MTFRYPCRPMPAHSDHLLLTVGMRWNSLLCTSHLPIPHGRLQSLDQAHIQVPSPVDSLSDNVQAGYRESIVRPLVFFSG